MLRWPCSRLLQLHELARRDRFAHPAWSTGATWTTRTAALRWVGLAANWLADQLKGGGGTSTIAAALLRWAAATTHGRSTALGGTGTLWCSRALGGAAALRGTRTLRRTRTLRWCSALGYRALLLVGRAHGHRRSVLIAVPAWLLRGTLLLSRGPHRHWWARLRLVLPWPGRRWRYRFGHHHRLWFGGRARGWFCCRSRVALLADWSGRARASFLASRCRWAVVGLLTDRSRWAVGVLGRRWCRPGRWSVCCRGSRRPVHRRCRCFADDRWFWRCSWLGWRRFSCLWLAYWCGRLGGTCRRRLGLCCRC